MPRAHRAVQVVRHGLASRCRPCLTDYKREVDVKKILELVLCVLHPIAVVLIWINLLVRGDIGFIAKLAWGIAAIVPFVPFLYVLTSNNIL